MAQLIKIEQQVIGADRVNSVDARALHVELEIQRQFTDWITNQIKSLGFEENIDYITFSQQNEKGRPSKEYIFTIDTAKHIALASRSKKGKEVRRYFIEVEKASRNEGFQLQLKRENIELKRTLNRLLSQELDTNVEKLKEKNTIYYENWQNAQANLQKLKNVFENI